MRTFLPLFFALMFNAAAGPQTLADLTRRYARDDQRLAHACRYERTGDRVIDQAWANETGEFVKVSRETREEAANTLEEFSMTEDGEVYFAFRKVAEKLPGGGTRITEERTYIADMRTLQKTRRSATFAPGAAAEIPEKAPAEKLDIKGLSDEERMGVPFNRAVEEIIGETGIPTHLIHDPAKGAPAEWQRVKLVKGTLSPDGRYALAWAPSKKDFQWADYASKDFPNDFSTDGETGDVVNFIADLRTHRIAGRTMGTHFGTRQRYNHRECVMAWAPDSRTFIELNANKWNYGDCCIGHLTDGNLDTVQNLGGAAEARAKEFLKASRHRGYRQHAKSMEAALWKPELKNDGTGSIDVTFQVPKSPEDDAVVTVRVRFRLPAGKNPPRLEMLGAVLAPDE